MLGTLGASHLDDVRIEMNDIQNVLQLCGKDLERSQENLPPQAEHLATKRPIALKKRYKSNLNMLDIPRSLNTSVNRIESQLEKHMTTELDQKPHLFTTQESTTLSTDD